VLRLWVQQRRSARAIAVSPAGAVPVQRPGPWPQQATTTVPGGTDRHIERSPVEPAPTGASMLARSADEVLRDLGHPGFQGGITVTASASLIGEATIAATVE
jgi:hypothetical protein